MCERSFCYFTRCHSHATFWFSCFTPAHISEIVRKMKMNCFSLLRKSVQKFFATIRRKCCLAWLFFENCKYNDLEN